MVEFRKRLIGVCALSVAITMVAPPADVAQAVTAQGSVVTPEILTISPASGPLTGGDLVTITGTDLDAVPFDPVHNPESSVYFGTTNDYGGVAARIITRTATSMVVQVPRGSAVGAVNVTLVTNLLRVTRDAGYTYLAPSFTSITPAAGSTAGGVSVTIKGVGFGYPRVGAGNSYISSVTMGGVPFSSFTRTNETTITGTVPASSVGAKNVVVTVVPHIGAPIVLTGTGAFSYVNTPSAPTITTISPANGPVAGGNTVQITGTNFVGSDTNPATVTIGGQPLTGVVVVPGSGNKTITGTVPAAEVAGKVNVVVQTSDGRATLVNGYEYAPAPTVSSVAPASGPLEGGTRITITGTNFGAAGNPTVTVGGVAAICVALVSPTTITAVVPPAAAGAADVAVSLDNGGGSTTAGGAFTYATATLNPTISAIAPTQGTAAGGTTITISGTGLGGASATVLVNGKCATDVAGSATSLTAKTPAGTVGWAEVKVATAAGTITLLSSAQRFRYVDITTVSPASGPTTGGTTVTISGSGFGATAPTVTIGGAAATVSSFSENSIVVTAPPGATGKRDVVVTPAAGGLLTKVGGFTYVAPTVISVTPNSGLVTGGTNVTVTGTGFGETGTPAVTFGGVAATGVVRQSNSQLTAVVPAGAAAGSVAVAVTPAVGTGTGTLQNGYTYAPAVRTPLIDNVSPDRGPNTGGTSVTVLGANFRGSNNTPATVTLGGLAVTGLSVNTAGTSLTFTTPAISAGYAQLRITTNEGSAVYFYAFISVGPPVVDSCNAVSPRGNVNYTGSNSVTVTGDGFGETGTPTVTINGTAATVSESSNTSVTFTIPNVPLGLLDISITPTTGGPAIVLNDCITLRRLLTITAVATPSSINYGASSAAFSYTVSGLQAGDSVTGVTFYFDGISPTNYAFQTTVPTNAGSYRVNPRTPTFSPGQASNYDIVYVPATYTINGLPATVTANDKTITYGDTPTAFTASATGLRPGETLNSVTYTFYNADYSSTTPPTVVGSYTIMPTVNSLTGGDVGNYSFTATTGTFTINRKPVTVTAAAKTKVYGETDPDLTFTTSPSSLPFGEGLVGSLERNSGEDVVSGGYSITQGSVTNANNPNYDITYVAASLAITKATVTVVADAKSKGYGEDDPELTYTATPDVELQGELSRAPGENVGTRSISQGTLTDNANYTILFTGALLTINKREITIAAGNKESTFGSPLPSNSVELASGSLRPGEDITGATYAYSTPTPVNAGDYSITPSAAVISGGGSGNYDISYEAGTLTILPKTVNVTPNTGQTKVYGASDPTLMFTLSDEAARSTLQGSLAYDGGPDVGAHPFTIGDLDSTSDNYELELDGSVTFAITQKPVTVIPDADQQKFFGEDDPSYTYTTDPDVSLTGFLGRSSGESVNTYSYSITDLQEEYPNYSFTLDDDDGAVTFAILKGTITVMPDSDQSKTYGESDPTLGYTTSPDVPLTGDLGRGGTENVGDHPFTLGTLQSTAEFDLVLAADAPTFEIVTREITIAAGDKPMTYGGSTPANSFFLSNGDLASGDNISSVSYSTAGTSPRDVGDYAITPSGAVFSSGSASNYSIFYVDGSLTVEAADATVTAGDQTITYGDATPTFTANASGLQGSDALDGVTFTFTGDSYDSTTPPTDAGVYTITPSVDSLSPGNVDNYSFSPVTGTFTIQQFSVTVTADDDTKVYNDGDPTFTVTANVSLPNGDVLEGSPDRDPGEDVGTYAITQGSVDGGSNPNYDIEFVDGELTITPLEVTVTPDLDQSKEFGATEPDLTFSLSLESIRGDLTGALERLPGEAVDTYLISEGSLSSGSANFSLIFSETPVTFEITPKSVTVSADDQTITFGESPAAFTASDSGLVGTDAISALTFTFTGGPDGSYDSTTPPTDAGVYTITPSVDSLSPGSPSDYSFDYLTGTFTIEAADATVSASSQTITYGDIPAAFTASATGLLGSDDLDGVTFTFTGGSDGSYDSTTLPTDVGEYTVTPSVDSLSPGNVDNYSFTATAGTFTIERLAVTVVPLADSKTYGEDDPTLEFTTEPSPLPFGDELAGALDRADGENVVVGGYAITQGTVDNEENPNYDIAFDDGSIFTINKASVVVTPDADQTKLVGADDPASLTFTVDPDVPLEGALTRDDGENVGEYEIRQGTLVDSENYEISFTEGVMFEITKRALVVEAEDQVSTFGDASLPTNMFTLTGELLGGDTFDGATATYDVSPPTDAGTYTITPSAAVISPSSSAGNYEITYQPGTLTIEPSEVTITAANASVQFGQDAPVFVSTAEGLLTPDALASTEYSFSGGGYGPSSTPPTAPGTYVMTPTETVTLSTGDVDNYTFAFVDGEYTITGSEVGSLVPIQGSYLGGTPFTISGFGLGKAGDSVNVTFGGNAATGVVVVDYRTISGLTPAFTLAEEYTAETVDVVVTTQAGEILLEMAYTYLPPRPTPLVQALSPDLGPRQGLTLLTIAGTNLTGSDGANPVILVDGNAASGVTVADDGSSVSSRTPPGEIDDPKDVELFTNEGAVAFLGAYTYFAPTITDITPDVGYEIGSIDDEEVVITGTGFGDTTPVVRVGGVAVTVTAHTPTSVNIVMPPRDSGVYDVEVIPTGDTGVTEEDGYEYIPVPVGDVDGLIWFDLDKNGTFEEGIDPVFPSLPVTLTLDRYLLPPPVRTTPAAVSSARAMSFASSNVSTSEVRPATAITFEFTTDENGLYDFSSLPYGRYVLTYRLPDDVETTYEPPDSVGGSIVIVINRPQYTANVGGVGQSTLKALVVEDDRTLYPDTDVVVRWWGSDQQFGTPDDVLILTSTDGESFVEFIANLPSGRYRVELATESGLVKISTTLDLLPVSTLTGDEFVFRNKRGGLNLSQMLPETGNDIARTLLSASLLLFGGAAMLMSNRRRRTSAR